MNPNNEQVPVPPQPHRSSFSCDRHPAEQFNGFCPVCLCERLTTLELSTETLNASASSSRRPSTLKGLFRGPSKNPQQQLQPELRRRTQSFSASKNEGFSGVLEPQRHSCDVRGRSTLWSLFNMDHHDNNNNRKSSASLVDQQNQIHEEREENGDEISVCEDEPVIVTDFAQEQHISEVTRREEFVLQEDEGQRHEEEVKTIKDHIDLDSHPKKTSAMDLKEIAGSFWSAASVFNKKWQKWRQNQKQKKRCHDRSRGGGPTLPVEKPISRQYRETQSEVADYSFGRRSCDYDPTRFSLDVPRISFDDIRPSFDQPRASWDGHLAGAGVSRASFPRLPPILSLVEDVHLSSDHPRVSWDGHLNGAGGSRGNFPRLPVAPINCPSQDTLSWSKEEQTSSFDKIRASWDGNMIGGSRGNNFPRLLPILSAAGNSPTVPPVARTDMQIPVEADNGNFPGGSTQTREYYSDSSHRKKSLDRSSSIRKTAASVVAEMDEVKVEHRVSVDSNSNLFRDDCSETFELGLQDNRSIMGNFEKKGLKKSRRWKNIWGLIVGRAKDEDEEERYERGNRVDRSFSSSRQEMRNKNVFRSYSNGNGGSFGNAKKTGFETNGRILERNRSARYSPNQVDNGLLRFYLTPLKGSCRRGGGGGGMGKSKANNSHSIVRSVLRLY